MAFTTPLTGKVLLQAACSLLCLPLIAMANDTPPKGKVAAWVTYTDQTRLLSPEPLLNLEPRSEREIQLNVNPAQRYQAIVGFGANLTDASAWLLQHKLSADQRSALLQELFGPAPGLGFSFTRLTLGASDFSTQHYSLDDVPAGQTDFPLAHFSLLPMQGAVLPVLRQAIAINPQLAVMASPWSAPAWMKRNDSLIKGTLRDDAYDAFARYLVKFADAMQEQGLPLWGLTVQNEPHFEPKDYPGMRLDPAQRMRLAGQYLGPLLAQRKPALQLLDWDHNWDEPQSPLQVLADSTARSFITGVAWHCYSGDVSAQGVVHDVLPDKDVYFTECSGGEWKPHWRETLPWFMRHLIIGTTRNWARGVLLWNLALDENHGPHLGGCTDCRGVITIDSRTGAVTRNFDYYALAHASRFVRPGAVRIASDSGVNKLESVAFQNADDGSIVLIVLNGAENAREFSVRCGEQAFRHRLPGASVATYVWQAPR
jgi:glucosylceramidase